MKHRRLLRGTFAASVVAAAVLACYGPTEVVLELRTDLHARNPRTLIRVGGTTATKDGAAGDGRIGELVLVPSGARDAPVELSVVTSVDGRSPDECETSADKTGCVFARRRFKFAPHESRSFVVFMSSVCLGKDCGAQTCEDGVCVAPSENKSDTNQGGDPLPPGPPPDAALDGAVADVSVDGPIDLLCPPTQRLVTNAANMVQHSLVVNASRVHWLEAAKLPTIAWIANTPGATAIEYASGDTFAIDKNMIVSALAGSGELTRRLFGPGGGVTTVTCPTNAIGGVAILSANALGVYITQNGTIQRVNTFDTSGCGLTPIPLPKGTFTTIWGTKDQIYGLSDEKTLSRVLPTAQPPTMAEVFAGGVPSAFATDGTAVAFTSPDGMTIFASDPITTPKEPLPFAQLAEPLLGLAMDARHVYWLEPQPGNLSQGVVALFRKERKEGMAAELIGRYAEAHSLAADDRCLYLHGREVVRGINARTGIFARPKTWIPSVNP